jgi:hypothetical protein
MIDTRLNVAGQRMNNPAPPTDQPLMDIDASRDLVWRSAGTSVAGLHTIGDRGVGVEPDHEFRIGGASTAKGRRGPGADARSVASTNASVAGGARRGGGLNALVAA